MKFFKKFSRKLPPKLAFCIAIALLILGGLFIRKSPRVNHFTPVHSYEAISMPQTKEFKLVTFDVDNTLIRWDDALALKLYKLPLLFKLMVLFKYPSLYKRETFEHITSLFYDQGGYHLTENLVPQFIKKLKEQGYIVLGLTFVDTGAWGVIKDIAEWRFEQLKRVGITFSKNYKNQKFRNLPSHRGNYPELYEGILCANHRPKGDVLEAFLKQEGLRPTSILSFDDSLEALFSVEDACARMNIPFTGYQYRGKAQKSNFDSTTALTQIEHLFKAEQWLSDKDVSKQRLVNHGSHN